MAHLTRIATYGDPNPFPLPQTAELTLEQRREYTFILTQDDKDDLLISEMAAREVSPLVEHLDIGSVYYFLGT